MLENSEVKEEEPPKEEEKTPVSLPTECVVYSDY